MSDNLYFLVKKNSKNLPMIIKTVTWQPTLFENFFYERLSAVESKLYISRQLVHKQNFCKRYEMQLKYYFAAEQHSWTSIYGYQLFREEIKTFYNNAPFAVRVGRTGWALLGCPISLKSVRCHMCL